MPCTFTGSLEGDQIMSLEQTTTSQKEKLDKLTRMLCAVLTRLEKKDGSVNLHHFLLMTSIDTDGLDPQELTNWWSQHKLEDERIERERLAEEMQKRKEEADARAQYQKLKERFGD